MLLGRLDLLRVYFSIVFAAVFVCEASAAGWSSSGGNPSNDRRAPVKVGFPSSGIPILGATGNEPDYAFSLTGRGSTPAMVSSLVLIATSDGRITAFDSKAGANVSAWTKDINVDYYGGKSPGARSTSTPAIWGSVAVVCVAGPADVLTIDAWDGHLIWRTTLDDHPYAAILSSGTISRSVFYVGTSFDSEKAKAETSSNGETPTATTVGFRGGFYALNLRTKRSEWSGPWNPFSGSTTPTVYENEGETEGFYGIDVIASTPPVDEDARTVFFVTGPLVAEGAAFRGSDSISNLSTCLEATTATRFYDELECMRRFAPTVYPNALVAVDAASGETKFVVPMSAKRSWEEACEGRVAEDEVCPSVSFHVAFQGGPFVNLLPSNPALWIDPSRSGKFLVISEKTGVVWKFDSATGDAIWASKTCPGGHWGGVAVNPSGTICASCVNEHHQAWRLLNSSTSTATLEGPSHCGGWVGIDAITGLTLWTTPDPTCGDGAESPFDTFGTGMSATAFAIAPPVSVLNGFVVASASARYVPDSATGSPVPGAGGGLVCVLEEKTGSIASSFETGTSICQGISSDSDKLYVASGCDPSVAGGVLSDGNAVFGWKLKIY